MRHRSIIGVAVIALATAGSVLIGVPTAAATARVVHPGESIQAVVDAAQPGDTVVVLPGTYAEAVCVMTDGIKLRGAGAEIVPPAEAPDTACMPDQQVGIALFGHIDFETGEVHDPISNVAVSGFHVEGFEAFGIGVFGGHDVDIVKTTTVDNEEYGIARFFSVGGTVTANRASGSEEAGIYLGDSPGANASIRGNRAWDNELFGIFVRDASQGTIIGNRSSGNCAGIFVLSTYAPTEEWTIKGNVVRDNSNACPPSEEAPPLSGLGIALAGASHSTVQGNVVAGNVSTGPTFASGGIAVFSTAVFGGFDPVGNLVKGNVARNNDPDLFYDGTGSGNLFLHNSCETSIPDGLC